MRENYKIDLGPPGRQRPQSYMRCWKHLDSVTLISWFLSSISETNIPAAGYDPLSVQYE